ncbi:MAG: L,D-transpeptidase [Thermoleophilia bacterium]
MTIRRLIVTMVALFALAAVPPASVTAGVAAASPAADPEPTPTVLSAAASHRQFTFGNIAAIEIHGSISVPGASLALSSRPANDARWAPVATTQASESGAFSFANVQAPSTTTEYAVSFTGNETQAAASTSITVSVRPRVVLKAANKTSWLKPKETVQLTGSVKPAHPGATIAVDRRLKNGSWIQVGSATLDSASRFTVGWRPDKYGALRLRARMNADSDHTLGVSATENCVVNLANAHMVPYKYAHFLVNVVHEYKLYYYEHGKLVRTFIVALGRPGYPTPLGKFTIYHKRRPGGGALGSCVMFYRRAGGIAIHGTNEPELLSRFPRNFSHGCTRMYNSQALWLYYRCPVGTPVKNYR